MKNIVSNSVSSKLQAKPILCLEHTSGKLYGEAIQLIQERQTCWFRPLCLVVTPETESSWQQGSDMTIGHAVDAVNSQSQNIISIDLQSGSDLLWPANLFRPALDTEIISLIPQLIEIERDYCDRSANQAYLNKFVRLVWQTERDRF